LWDLKKPLLLNKRRFSRPSRDVESGLAKVGVKKPREEVGGYPTAGEIIGGIGPSLPGVFKSRAEGVVRVHLPRPTREASAKAAEKLGFKLVPCSSRARPRSLLGAQGATFFGERNQRLANELASKGTGKQVNETDEKFVRRRFQRLGSVNLTSCMKAKCSTSTKSIGALADGSQQ